MKITNKETAIDVFVDSVRKHAEATKNGEGKECNKNYKKIVQSVKFLLDNNLIFELKPLLQYPYSCVRCWAATYLIFTKSEEEACVKTLEDIQKENVPFVSSSAKLVLEQWNCRNLVMPL